DVADAVRVVGNQVRSVGLESHQSAVAAQRRGEAGAVAGILTCADADPLDLPSQLFADINLGHTGQARVRDQVAGLGHESHKSAVGTDGRVVAWPVRLPAGAVHADTADLAGPPVEEEDIAHPVGVPRHQVVGIRFED